MRILAVLLVLLLSACGSDKPINFACPKINDFRIHVPVTPGGAIPAVGSPLDAAFAEALRSSRVGAIAGSSEQKNVLVLSGGGKWGAYGAGVIAEWSNKNAPARPQFDIVTGISTGALQSTFAFVGNSADSQLIDAYDIENESELVRRHGKLFFLRHGSSASLGPLVKYARDRAEPFYDAVASEGKKGRLLLVGVVDALDGQMYAIDMTRIAAELRGKERSDCYVGALLAAAAIPVVFKQVTINGVPYFDAGVRQSVFLTEIQGSAARAVTPGAMGGGNLYILMNGVPGVAPKSAVKPTIMSSISRLREITFDQIEQNSVYSVSQQAPTLTTWVTTARGHGCKETESDEDIFNPVFMRCLIDAGRGSWEAGSPWKRYPT